MTQSPGAEPPAIDPGLYLVATPIGNLEDITLRALRVLAAADVLVCEDTRVTRRLFQRHGLPAPATLLVANDHTEKSVAQRLTEYAARGKVVVYCSDAGVPGISDPGFHLVQCAVQAGVAVQVIPGASAVVTAVAVSGVPAAHFTFFGFPPRRDGRLREVLRDHGTLRPALVFYESPRRLGRLLAFAADVLGRDRSAAVCLELTKKFERVVRGGVGDLAERYAGVDTRGEAVVVIAGAGRGAARENTDTGKGDDE
ncbi:MAG: 16S rRNA (cytidine(1402)-2'-O)-methyltransferase [Planctomycetes bacterium]|nr:16S rRNA (cytidine(1402)-2'-O)-methyltransferase [Planctomycetota bacterium]